MNTQANRLKIILFEGDALHVEQRVNAWLAAQPAGVRTVAMEYNYQAPEVGGRGQLLSSGQHGILLSYTFEEGGPNFHKDCVDGC